MPYANNASKGTLQPLSGSPFPAGSSPYVISTCAQTASDCVPTTP
jgi:hypothetical protein